MKVSLPEHPQSFLEGTLLLVDKPKSWTSFDVVNKIRFKLKHLLAIRKIKVGHAGTLDPMATGLLLICTGKWTKKLTEFQGLDKEYTGTLRLGATTPSFDAETEIEERFPVDHITNDLLEMTRAAFLGHSEQFPPMYSAIKVDGQPLYKKARRGEKVEVKARPIIIHELQWTHINLPDVEFRVSCSKGTYIRSLAFDIGKRMDSGAYLSALRRTRIGNYSIDNAWKLEDLIASLDEMEAQT